MRLEGKVALISGGARGMGAVEARLFTKEGAKVVIGDVLEEEGRQVAQEIENAGGQVHFAKLDVTSEENWQEVVTQTTARYGGLDILVNNAGIYRISPLEQTSLAVWERIMQVNVAGVFLGTKVAIPR